MVARVGTMTAKSPVEELHFRSESVYVCLVVNRRHRSARVVDFLAGNFPQKQAAIQSIAVKEGIERVYTLVEREESSGWVKSGYAREGSIPGYYKRSDAYVLGHLIHDPPLLDSDGSLIAPTAEANRAEKALNAAKKLREELTPLKTAHTRLLSEREFEEFRSQVKSLKKTTLPEDRFGRTGTRVHIAARDSKAGSKLSEQVIAAEVQDCFGNAHVQLSAFPTTDSDARMLISALHSLTEELCSREVASAFLFSPVTDTWTNAALLAAGYKKTGLLAQHLVVAERRCDAVLWTRKLSTADADAA